MRYLSKTEQVLIVIVGGLLVLFVYVEFFSVVINNYNYDVFRQQSLLNEQAGGKEIISLSGASIYISRLHLFSLLLVFALIWGRKFYFAFVLIFIYIAFLLYSHYSWFRDLDSALQGWQADSFKLTVLGFLLVLGCWVASIVLRVILQTKLHPKLD